MKNLKNVFTKAGIGVLSLCMTLSVAACNDNNNNNGTSYDNPNEAFTTYDNRSFNEYLMKDQTTIKPQWEGYGIGDPFIMRYDGTYYLYCSTLDTQTGVRAYKSENLIDWTPVAGQGLPEGYVSTDPCTKAAYAPEVYYFNGTFYMYTSPGGNGHYILTSDSPEGPFVKATNNFGLSIDGSVFIDDDESMWFTYASSGGIRMAKMDNMLSVNALSTPQLNETSIGGWTEGSYILKNDGVYYLTYTGNHVASDGYRIAYSTATKIAAENGSIDRNAFTRAANNPLALNTDAEFKGIGHSSTVLGPDMDSYYLAYHVLNSAGGPNRSLAIDRLLFNGRQMSVATMPTGSVKPALPKFSAKGIEDGKLALSNGTALSSLTAGNEFTAEFNVSGVSKPEFVVGYQDDSNYVGVVVDYTGKTIELVRHENGNAAVVSTGTLVNDFDPTVNHTVRVSVKDGKVNVVFDNMTKIEKATIEVKDGKIGYKGLSGSATVGYTAFSNTAMGSSDSREVKQSSATIGASLYLKDGNYYAPAQLGAGSGIKTLEEYPYEGVKTVSLAQNGDFVSYLVNYNETGRYALELTYKATDGGKKIGVTLGDGIVWRCTLPKVNTEETFVKAIVGEFETDKAEAKVISLVNLGETFEYMSLSFCQVSATAPSYEQTLENYAEKGADYKTIWKLKDGGHYAKAGTRQLVYFGNDTITDFTLEVEIKLEGSTGTSTAGIVFRADNYAASSHDGYMSIQGYYLSVNNNQIVLERMNYSDGTQMIGTLAQDNPFKDSDAFVKLSITVRGNTIVVKSGDRELIKVDDATAFTHGKIGLYTNGAAAIYRNLKISA